MRTEGEQITLRVGEHGPVRGSRNKRLAHGEGALEDTRMLFAALADRAWLRIFHALKGGEELWACNVVQALGSSISTASHHAAVLIEGPEGEPMSNASKVGQNSAELGVASPRDWRHIGLWLVFDLPVKLAS